MLLALLMVWLPNVVMAAGENDDLQEFINNSSSTLTRASDVIEVDLSKFTATTRTKTLEISTGKSYRFTNGTLTAADSFSGLLLKVSKSSTVELASTAILKPGNNTDSNYRTGGIVELNGASFIINGGTLEAYPFKGVVLYTTLLKTQEGTTLSNNIKIEAGYVYGQILTNNSKDDVSLLGGYVYSIYATNCEANILFNAKSARLNKFISYVTNSNKEAHLKYISSIKGNPDNYVSFAKYKNNPDLVIAEGYNYQLNSNDVKYMKFNFVGGGADDYEIYLDGNQAKVRKTAIASSDELQARLNEIAANGTGTYSKPDTVMIADAGIDIDKMITVPAKCYAVLKGGSLKFTNGIRDHYAFYVSNSAMLSLQNITLDCNNNVYGVNNVVFNWYFGLAAYGGNSYLSIGQNVTFNNISSNNNISLVHLGENKGEACFFYYSGDYKTSVTAVDGEREQGVAYIYGGSIESSTTAIKAKVVCLYYGSSVKGSNTVVDCRRLYIDNKSTIKCIDTKGTCVSLGSQDAFSTGNFVGGKNQIEVREALYMSRFAPLAVYLCANATLHTFENKVATTNVLTIDGDWSNFTLEKAFMSNVDPSEYKYYKFINIPDDREIYYNEKAKTVSIRKKVYDEDDLQHWINGGGSGNEKGTEEDPKTIDLPSGGCVINDPVGIGSGNADDDLQWFINGDKGDGTNKDFVLKGSGSFTIKKYTTLTLTNLNLSNTGSGYIYVEGTLIIDININITRLIRLIRILSGGRVIWKGGNGSGTDITKEFFYVEDGGIFEYHGGTISGGEFGFHGYGETYIYGGNIGGTKYGGYTYPSGTTTISGGTISGGYYNGGTTTISGGTFIGGGSGIGGYVYWNGKGGNTTISGGTFGTGGKGTIYNGGNLYLGGDGYAYDYIYNGASGRIYIIAKLNIIIRIHIKITDIILDTPIILGGNGYVLTADDIKKIQIILPDGYTWRYDASRGGIIITSTTGIKDVTVDADNEAQYFDASGRKIEKLQKGLNIVKTSDGKTKKVMIK